METNEHNLLDLNGLTGKEKAARLFEVLKGYPIHISYFERLHSISARTGIAPKLLLQTARRHGWETQLATLVAAQKEREEYAARLEATAPLAVDIPVTRIAANVKGLVWTLLTASRRYVDTCCLMLTYYSDQIALKIAEAGGLAHLDATAAKEMGELQAKLSYYAKQLQPYMAPGPISTLLATIDFTNKLPASDEEVQQNHFTIHALQKRMLELGMISGPAFANPEAATEGYGELPELSGWHNARPDERQQYGLPEAAAETSPDEL
jgi:hypothetical protein